MGNNENWVEVKSCGVKTKYDNTMFHTMCTPID